MSSSPTYEYVELVRDALSAPAEVVEVTGDEHTFPTKIRGHVLSGMIPSALAPVTTGVPEVDVVATELPRPRTRLLALESRISIIL